VQAALAQAHSTAVGPAYPIVACSGRPSVKGGLEIHGLDEAASVAARLALPGRHNAENGLVAAGVAWAAGASSDAIVRSLASYPGVGRRLELKGDAGGVVVLDDYGHHPTAMAATFATVREQYPGRRLWAVYEPLTYHRTAAMLEEFADVLATADQVAIAEIHAGRDPDTTITSAAALADAVARRGTPARAPGTVEESADWLANEIAPGDVVLVMGGGRSYVIADRLAAILAERAAT
jgi:UDP-N-acetylmuramate--alanine ligase